MWQSSNVMPPPSSKMAPKPPPEHLAWIYEFFRRLVAPEDVLALGLDFHVVDGQRGIALDVEASRHALSIAHGQLAVALDGHAAISFVINHELVAVRLKGDVSGDVERQAVDSVDDDVFVFDRDVLLNSQHVRRSIVTKCSVT